MREVVRQAKAHNHQFPTMLLHWLQIPKFENSQVKTVSIKEGYPASKNNVFGLEKNLDCNLSPWKFQKSEPVSAFWPIMQPSLLWDSFPELRYKIEKGLRAVYQLCKWQIPGGTRVPLWFANVDLARLRLCHWTPTYVMEVAIWSTREVHEVEDMRRSYKRKTPEYFNLWFVWLWGRVEGWQKWTLDTGQCSYFFVVAIFFSDSR